MIRNEKGRFESTKENEMSVAQKEAICYKSKLLNKYFDDYGELVKAEDAYTKAHAAELEAAEKRKTRAKEIEEAYKEVIATRKEAKAILDEANKKASDLIRTSEDKYTKLKNDFIKDYHSFHMSFTDTDGNTVVSVSDFLDSVFNNFWHF